MGKVMKKDRVRIKIMIEIKEWTTLKRHGFQAFCRGGGAFLKAVSRR